jgi:hypothetical protein
MAHPGHFQLASTALVIAALLTAAACGSSDSTSDSSTPADTAAETAAPGDDAAPITAAPEPADTAADAAPVATAAPVEDGGGSDEVVLTLDDGRTWALVKNICTFDPDATGPAAAIINIDGSGDAGVGLSVIEAWPFDGSTDKGTPFLGSFVDENEEVLVLVKDAASLAGDELELTGGYYTNVFYQEGDAPDGTYTVRCQPSV